MQGKSIVRLAAIAITLLVLSSGAWADLTIDVYRVPGNLMPAASPGSFSVKTNIGSITGIVGFDAIQFQATGTQTLGDFVASGGGIYSGTNASDPMSDPSCSGQPTCLYSTLIVITGSVSLMPGTTYSLRHDDGVIMTVDGSTFINAPTPTSPATSTSMWTGSAGSHSFEIDYIATNGNPEVLQARTPEADSILLLGSMWVGLAGLFGRRLRRL